ncbi:MAG: 30S ribosomal protein S2 [Candidatus Paceibacterota bacterium]|jgi:small subunit ribosomal protein S2
MAIETKQTDMDIKDFQISIDEMSQAGVNFGHKTSRLHPKMQPYILKVKDSVHFIDLEKSAQALKEAINLIRKIVMDGKTVLMVGTKVHLRDMLEETAIDCGLPYVKERWIGGTFTNFEEIRKRIQYFKDLEAKTKEVDFEKNYTKKERSMMNKEIARLKMKFGGIKEMDKLPEALFALDMKKDAIAIKEARDKGIKVIALADTNVNPTLADYPIPANDDAVSSVRYILGKIKEAVSEVRPSLKIQEEKK